MSLFRFEYETKLSLEECDKRLNTEYLERKERETAPPGSAQPAGRLRRPLNRPLSCARRCGDGRYPQIPRVRSGEHVR
jgi:hypothetical protein